MKKFRLVDRITFLVLIGFVLSACSVIVPQENETDENESPIGMANPAAVYCEGMGYSLESVEREGGLDADCVFPDGQSCAQWDFLAGRCGQSMSYCQLAGGTIQEFGNMGICEFSDGSTCGEFQLFSGECARGDNPTVEEEAEVEEEEIEAEEAEAEAEVIELKDFSAARDYLAAYFAREYGVEITQEWLEQDITSADAAGVNTIRFVSGPMTIVLSAQASAPYASLYTVREATNLSNAFYWVGSVSFDGSITEDQVSLPYLILNAEQARDAALGYLYANSEISSPLDWMDLGMGQAGDFKTSHKYSSGSWQVDIQFEPAAPFVSSYLVIVDNADLGLRWEGQISGQGDIVQISYVG